MREELERRRRAVQEEEERVFREAESKCVGPSAALYRSHVSISQAFCHLLQWTDERVGGSSWSASGTRRRSASGASTRKRWRDSGPKPSSR